MPPAALAPSLAAQKGIAPPRCTLRDILSSIAHLDLAYEDEES
jgi:hypothetical protein